MMPGPFDLNDVASYRRWREAKLDSAPRRIEDIVVALDDPRALSVAERDSLLRHCASANMAIYTSNTVGDADKEIPRRLGAQLGLLHLDSHWLTDDDAISPISVRGAEERGERKEFIPYTDKPIKWHTDGYYNVPERTVRGMVLHCVQRAESGGENQLLDHEIAYILLRDANPEHVRALSLADAMTIPPRNDDNGVARGAQSGPRVLRRWRGLSAHAIHGAQHQHRLARRCRDGGCGGGIGRHPRRADAVDAAWSSGTGHGAGLQQRAA